MQVVHYKGFAIVPAPYQGQEHAGWNLNVYIRQRCDLSGQITETIFDANDAFSTREQAVDSCIQFGKNIIDGDFHDLARAHC